MKQILIVFKETYLRQIKSWSFVMMVFGPFLMIGLSLGIGLLTETQSDRTEEVALVSKGVELGETDSFLLDYDEKSAQEALEKEDLLGYVLVERKDQQIQATYHGDGRLLEKTDSELKFILEQAQKDLNYEAASLSPTQEEIVSKEFSLTEDIREDKDIQQMIQTMGLMFINFMIYMMLLIYAQTTAQEVASEKGTKIMEVIFSSIPASHYFYGRLLGILGVVVTHMSIYGIGGLIGLQFIKSMPMVSLFLNDNPDIMNLISHAVGIHTLLFAVVGIVLYVALAAFCGSLVNRQEDVPKAVQPAMYLVMFGFFGTILLGNQADSLLLKIGSYIPFLSTFFMPARLVNESATSMEAWISLGLLTIFNIGFVYSIGKIYGSLVLQTDDIGLWKSFKRALAHSK